MPYKISGTKSETVRVMVVKESDWSIESNTVVSGSGDYEILSLEEGKKLIVARTTLGESDSYADVSSVYYNIPPVAHPDSAEVWKNSSATIDLLANDTDYELQPLTVTNLTAPSHGSLVNHGDGIVTYTPTEDYLGADSFDYTISDPAGGIDTSSCYITVDRVFENIIGTPSVFQSSSTNFISPVVLDSSHACLSYMEDINDVRYGRSIIGTIDGTSITWGGEYTFNTEYTNAISSVMLDSSHVLISYADGSNYFRITAIVGTINGTSISWGSERVINSDQGNGSFSSNTVMIDSTHVMILYTSDINNNDGYAKIITISNGNVLSTGSEKKFNYTGCGWFSSVRLDSTHICVSYSERGGDNSYFGTSRIVTISNENIMSWGATSVFNSAGTSHISSVMIDSTHVMVSYKDGGNSNRGKSIIGTIDGTTITWGSEYTFNTATTEYISSVALDYSHILVSYSDGGDGVFIVGTIDGTSITFGSANVFDSGSPDYIFSVLLGSSNVLVSYQDGGNSNYGTARILY